MPLRLCLALLCATAHPASAQDQPAPNLAAQGTGVPGGVARIAFAHQLYALGAATKDPLSVLNAARLAASVKLTETPRTHESSSEPTDVAAAPLLSPAQMFESAATLAAQDEDLLDLIDASKREAGFAPIVNVVSATSTLTAAQTDTWPVPFYGGSLAEVAILGGASGALDLQVADENGNLVCKGASTAAYCSFYPATNGSFIISVTNNGSAENSYVLLTN